MKFFFTAHASGYAPFLCQNLIIAAILADMKAVKDGKESFGGAAYALISHKDEKSNRKIDPERRINNKESFGGAAFRAYITLPRDLQQKKDRRTVRFRSLLYFRSYQLPVAINGSDCYCNCSVSGRK